MPAPCEWTNREGHASIIRPSCRGGIIPGTYKVQAGSVYSLIFVKIKGDRNSVYYSAVSGLCVWSKDAALNSHLQMFISTLPEIMRQVFSHTGIIDLH